MLFSPVKGLVDTDEMSFSKVIMKSECFCIRYMGIVVHKRRMNMDRRTSADIEEKIHVKPVY